MGKRFEGKTVIFFIVLCVVMMSPFLFAGESSAFNGAVELSAGYDDNAEMTRDARGSGFLLGKLRLSETLAYEPSLYTAGVYAEGQYQDYFRFEDRYSAAAGGAVRREFLDGLLAGELFCEASLYRDKLIPEDDFDGVTVGAGASWILSGQTEALLRQRFSWNDFRNKSTVYRWPMRSETGAMPLEPGFPGDYSDSGFSGDHTNSGFPGDHADSGFSGLDSDPGGDMEPSQPYSSEKSRDDCLSSTELSLVYYMGPSVTATFTAEYQTNSSSVKGESYDSAGGYFAFDWKPEQNWRCILSLSAAKYDFDRDDLGKSRSDKIRAAGLRISRYLGAFELYARIDLTETDSDFETEDYRQTVTQCGVSWSF